MSRLFSLERFDRPDYLWLGLIFIALWWMSRRSLSGLGPVRGRLALATRSIVLLLLIFAAAGAHRILETNDLTVLFLVDQSRSIPTEVRKQSEEFIQRVAAEAPPDDRVAILTFDGSANIEQLPSRPGPDGAVHIPMPLAAGQSPDRTNLAQGLRVAAACAQNDTNNRVILLSDGIQNIGDALEEAKTAKANNLRVDVVPLTYEYGAEVVFEQLLAPPYSNLHEQVPLRLILKSDRATSGSILIYQRVGQEERLLDLSPNAPGSGQHVQLAQGRNAFNVRVPINEARAHDFRAEFVPDDKTADFLGQNNVARAFTNVEGPQTVLMIGTAVDEADNALLVEAMEREGIRVQSELAESINIDTATLQDFSAVILANVPAEIFSAEQQKALAAYVRDLGGGLLMLGGDESFAAGGWQGSVVEDIMPIKFDVDSVKQIPRGALAIVMHACEMPQGNTWGVETAVAAVKTISSLDYFGLVDWGMGGYTWEVPMRTASNKEAIISQIRKMQNSDMPDFHTPMQMAYNGLMECKDAAQRHMIVISDGDPAPPQTGLLNKMVGNKITCSTISIFPHGGQEIATLDNIRKVTGGRYYSLSKPGDEKQLPKIFIKEARVVRRPLVRDEIFTPKVKPNLSEIMVGIDGIPQLKGYVVTTPRKVADVEMPLVTERGDPLLAHWLCGFGRTLAFTSGRWKHWGTDWASWSGFSKLWSQAVRWSMQQGAAANFDVSTVVEGDEGHIVIESLGEGETFENFRQFVGRAIAPDGSATPVSIVQTGPGRYEGKFKLGEQGTYLLNVISPSSGADDKPTMIRTGVTVAYSPEFRDLEPNEALLREIAEVADGRLLSTKAASATIFDKSIPSTITRTPIWEFLLKLALFMFLLDVAVRRIAVDPVKSLAYARNYIAGLAGRFGAGQRAARTLTELKDVRQKVRAERTKEGDARSAAPSESASIKFEAQGDLKKPAADLTKALGGADAAAVPPAARKADKSDKPTESTTARLLKAKKRARDQQDEQP